MFVYINKHKEVHLMAKTISKKEIPLSEKEQTVKIKNRQRSKMFKIGIARKLQYVWQVQDVLLNTYEAWAANDKKREEA
jgi:hypothetical protein